MIHSRPETGAKNKIRYRTRFFIYGNNIRRIRTGKDRELKPGAFQQTDLRTLFTFSRCFGLDEGIQRCTVLGLLRLLTEVNLHASFVLIVELRLLSWGFVNANYRYDRGTYQLGEHRIILLAASSIYVISSR